MPDRPPQIKQAPYKDGKKLVFPIGTRGAKVVMNEKELAEIARLSRTGDPLKWKTKRYPDMNMVMNNFSPTQIKDFYSATRTKVKRK